MQKILKPLLIAAFSMSCIVAEAATTEFTYAEGELFGYGQGMKENIDVAICINNPSLAGMNLLGFRAYLAGVEGIENTSMWLSKELRLENKTNVPDIATYDVAPVLTPYEGDKLGMLSIDLPQPYMLTEEPLYLGYSLTVADNSSLEAKYPVVLSDGYNPNGLFLHMSKSVLKWMDYSKKSGGVAYIVAVLEGELNEYSLGISDYKEANVMVGSDFSVEFMVNNNGTRPVDNLKYSYTYDHSPKVYEGETVLPAALIPDVTATLPLTLEFEGLSEIGPHMLHLTIREINGQPNASPFAKKDCLINVMPYNPVHRPLVEEFTGLWCGWCPRGWVAMDLLGEKYGEDVVVICYHNGDGMAVTNVYPVDFEGYPNASLNRSGLLDPYYGTYDESFDFGISYDVENSMADNTMVDLKVEAAIEGNTVNVNSTAIFMKDIPDANYQVGYVLTANGLKNEYWIQTNYYTGLTEDYIGTYLEEVCEMPARIRNLTFNDVAVDVSGMNGIEGSLPSSLVTAREYSHSYSFDITDNALIQNRANLIVTAFVINKTTGAIVNSNKYALAGDAGVDEIIKDASVEAVDYYDFTGKKLSGPSSGMVIKRERLSDGSIRTTKSISVN